MGTKLKTLLTTALFTMIGAVADAMLQQLQSNSAIDWQRVLGVAMVTGLVALKALFMDPPSKAGAVPVDKKE